jgi:hypothetical protein
VFRYCVENKAKGGAGERGAIAIKSPLSLVTSLSHLNRLFPIARRTIINKIRICYLIRDAGSRILVLVRTGIMDPAGSPTNGTDVGSLTRFWTLDPGSRRLDLAAVQC